MSQFTKSKSMKVCGVDDMVLLTKIEVPAITENLEKRLKNDIIYTYIGPVLVAVNPFKALPYFTDKEVDMYQGAAQYENPPHIYALCDDMYRSMVTDGENQCCIISGESGAGKTVSAKFVMNYITKVSGGGKDVQRVKDIILQSNPLLEAFGNAKTIRNDNSSRFGKYTEILFNRGYSPCGGKISNFLLEKSRVVSQNKGERNFHIFYQLIAGLSNQKKNEYGITEAKDFSYINQSGCYTIPDVDDKQEYNDVITAMDTIEIDKSTQDSILKIISAILHIGNINFTEVKNQAQATNNKLFDYPAKLLGVDANYLRTKFISREMESKWGKSSEVIQIEHNLEQAIFTRDALAKGVYDRVFNFLVQAVNQSIVSSSYENSIGILDIYGFEIFNKNGFEQFCINYVNEKLQQIFIELTLKKEQEEYVKEGINWNPIKYFNNKIVCDLFESKRNPCGIMSILDDVCATMHAKSEGADNKLTEDLSRSINVPEHFQISGAGFIVHHYAGRVTYDTDGFCERNRDVFFVDLIELMQSSTEKFLVSLFPESVQDVKAKGRPTTASSKIKTQANDLVGKLMACQPHYIRCIKPNETKKPYDFDEQRVKHQVDYLGLKENIRIKRAGFAFNREFDKFLHRFAICTPETFPKWKGSVTDGIKHICNTLNLDADEWQLGKTKVFIKKPESLFLFEEIRERKYDHYAFIIQKAWRNYHGNVKIDKGRQEALDIVCNHKKRYWASIRRRFYGDYIGVDENSSLRKYAERKEKVQFSAFIEFYGPKLKPEKIDYMVTNKNIYMVGRIKVKKGPKKGQIEDDLRMKVPLTEIKSVTLSPFQDDFIMINFNNGPSILFTTPMKTELAYVLTNTFRAAVHRTFPITFEDKFKYVCQKTKGTTNITVTFKEIDLPNDLPKVKSSRGKLNVNVRPGKPASSQPEMASSKASGYRNIPSANPVRSYQTPAANTAKAPTPKPKKAAAPLPVSKYPIAIAQWDYTAQDDDEISFRIHDQIQIVEEDPSGWWLGICNGQKGTFPGNYVEKA